MLESRNFYGFGYIGTGKGFDWKFIPNKFSCYGDSVLCGGETFPDEETAIKAGKKWLLKYNNSKAAQKYGFRHGQIIAIKNNRVFGY